MVINLWVFTWADRGGLEVGDRILAVDGVSLKDKPSSIVERLLTREPEVTMTLKWTGHLPKWRLVKEKTAWSVENYYTIWHQCKIK